MSEELLLRSDQFHGFFLADELDSSGRDYYLGEPSRERSSNQMGWNKISISKILVHFISEALEYYGSFQEFLNSFTQI